MGILIEDSEARNLYRKRFVSPESINFESDQYAQVYGDSYKNQIRRLQSLLLQHETGEDNFVVYSLEAGLGKSFYTNKILHKHFKRNPLSTKKFLLVKTFATDADETEVEGCINEISATLPNLKILGITSENWSNEWKEKKDELKEFSILVITHQRYKDLCLEPSNRNSFTQDRQTLIIDEKISFPMYSFDTRMEREIMGFLPRGLRDEYIAVTKPLNDLVEQFINKRTPRNKGIICYPQINDEYLTRFSNSVNDNRMHFEDNNWSLVQKFMESLKKIYSSKCIYNFNRICTYNKNHKLWGLRNNIILDANGGSEPLYSLASNITVDTQHHIIDHSQSKLQWFKCKSSSSAIKNHRSVYLEGVCQLIKERKKETDKVLLVIQKSFIDELIRQLRLIGIYEVGERNDYNGEPVAVNNFGNLIGKNNYSNFTQVWILGTPNEPMQTHIYRWKNYLQKELNETDITMSRGRGCYKFNNAYLEQLRNGQVVGDIYQSAKRIQRVPMPCGEIFIVTNAEGIVGAIANQMNNIQVCNPIEPPFARLLSHRQQPTDAQKFVEYMRNSTAGTYLKRDVCNLLGINSNNFYRIVRDLDVTGLVSAGVIEFPSNNRLIIRH